MNLVDKVVVITGSSSGIGQRLALRFAEEGAIVVVNYRSNKAGAEETLGAITNIKQRGIIIQADISNPQDVERLFKTAHDKFGSIDILINNAAYGTDNVPFLEATKASLTEMLSNNLVGPMLCSQYAIKFMRQQGGGKILFTSSVRGIEYGGRSPVYAATKAGINSFTKTLAKQLAPNILVNAVAPGAVKTRTFDAWPQEVVDSLLDMQYLNRFITKDEVADAFIFLAKHDAITGQILYVDGGYTLK